MGNPGKELQEWCLAVENRLAALEAKQGDAAGQTSLFAAPASAPTTGRAAVREVTERFCAYLNRLTDRTGPERFRPDSKETQKRVGARLSDGYTPQDLHLVAWHCVEEWKGDERMSRYMQPSTLLRSEKFADRLANAKQAFIRQGGDPRALQ